MKGILSRPPDVQAEEVVQEAAPALVALHRTRRLPDAASAPRDGSVAPEAVEAQVRNVGGPLGDACALYYEDG